MVPKPVWERPEVRTYDPNAKTDAPLPTDLPESAKTSSTVSGRWWKTEHHATTRAQSGKKDAQQQDKAWKAREERRKREEAVKKLERSVFNCTLACMNLYSADDKCCCSSRARAPPKQRDQGGKDCRYRTQEADQQGAQGEGGREAPPAADGSKGK